MATTAITGAVSWGPQPKKGTVATRWFRHRGTLVDLAVADDVRLGPPEIGGTPVATFPYKAGPLVGGGITMMPRLKDTFGWLLHGLMGSYSGSASNWLPAYGGSATGLHGSRDLTTGSTLNSFVWPAVGGRYYVIACTLSQDITSGSPTITLSGSASGSIGYSETFELGGRGAGTYYFYTRYAYDKINSVVYPAVSTGGSASAGWLMPTSGSSVFIHQFIFADDETSVPWMSFRKHIPRKDSNPATDLGEVYLDCKALSAAVTLPNDGPIAARLDFLGRSFTFDYSPNLWTYENTMEDYTSIPLGVRTEGWISVSGSSDLPIVAATVTFANIPLDIRQERVYGDPFIEDITIISRSLAYDLLVKWNNPDLYAQVVTASRSGSAWSATPFTGTVEVFTDSPTLIGSSGSYYSLKIESQKVMLTMNGPVTLASNQAIMMRFTGNAIEADAGYEYCIMTLRNQAPHYCWPYNY
jgi:hypothetical protein